MGRVCSTQCTHPVYACLHVPLSAYFYFSQEYSTPACPADNGKGCSEAGYAKTVRITERGFNIILRVYSPFPHFTRMRSIVCNCPNFTFSGLPTRLRPRRE